MNEGIEGLKLELDDEQPNGRSRCEGQPFDGAILEKAEGLSGKWRNCAGRNRTYDLQVMSLAS